MSNNTRLARPYAVAAFEYAREHDAYAAWSRMLAVLSEIALALGCSLDNPVMSAEKKAEHVTRIAGDFLNREGEHFVRLLAVSRRLAMLPAIAALFEEFYATVNKTIAVRVESAVALQQADEARLTTALKKRFHREPVLQCEVNPDLIAGWIIHAGDTVIDGSAKGQLTLLQQSLAR